MRICIYCAGAIGGYMAALLARAGYQVSLVARGPHMQAIQARERRQTVRDYLKQFILLSEIAASPRRLWDTDVNRTRRLVVPDSVNAAADRIQISALGLRGH
jgi:ketopantoate reductase